MHSSLPPLAAAAAAVVNRPAMRQTALGSEIEIARQQIANAVTISYRCCFSAQTRDQVETPGGQAWVATRKKSEDSANLTTLEPPFKTAGDNAATAQGISGAGKMNVSKRFGSLCLYYNACINVFCQ